MFKLIMYKFLITSIIYYFYSPFVLSSDNDFNPLPDSLFDTWHDDEQLNSFMQDAFAQEFNQENNIVSEEEKRTIDPSILEKISEFQTKTKTNLYIHQIAGISFLMSQKRSLLADDMGLGKSLQAILACILDASLETVLVIAPPQMLTGWEEEIKKWSSSYRQIKITKEKVIKSEEKPHNELNFILASSRNFNKLKQFINNSYQAVIVDEVHQVTTAEKANQEISRLLVDKKVILLSGTPIRQSKQRTSSIKIFSWLKKQCLN